MSRLSETSNILKSPKAHIASEAGDRKPAKQNVQRKVKEEPAVEKPIASGPKTLGAVHRVNLYFDTEKSAFGQVLDDRLTKLSESVPSDLGIKAPKGSAVVSSFFKENDAELAELLKKHLAKRR